MIRESGFVEQTPEEEEVATHFANAWSVHRINYNLPNETSLEALDWSRDIIWYNWCWWLWIFPYLKFKPRFSKEVVRRREQVFQDQDDVFRQFLERTTLLPNPLPESEILRKCWYLQYPKIPEPKIIAGLFALIVASILIVVVVVIVVKFPKTPKVGQLIQTEPTPDLDQIPNISNLMADVVLGRKSSTPGLQDCYLTSNQTMEMKSIIRHNGHCTGQPGVKHITEVDLNQVSEGTLQQALDEYQNSTIGLYIRAGFHCNQQVEGIVDQLTESEYPNLRIVILSTKDTSCSAKIMGQLEENLKAPNLQGIWQVQNEDIFVRVAKQDTSNRQFVEQLTRQIVAVEMIRQSIQNVHVDMESKMSTEVTTAVATSLTDKGIQLFSARYKLTESNYTGILQVPILPAEVVHVLWELDHVPETSELSLTNVFGKFPENIKELTLEIEHKNVKKITNLDDIKELCAKGRFSYGKSSDGTTYVISCKFTE